MVTEYLTFRRPTLVGMKMLEAGQGARRAR